MKNSAAVPSGALAKRRLRKLTKLMPIIFARYLASLTVYVPSSQSAPFIHALLCRSTRRVMSSRASDVSAVTTAGRCRSGRRVACASSCSGTRVACTYWRIAADTAASTGERLDAAHSTSLRAGLLAATTLPSTWFCDPDSVISATSAVKGQSTKSPRTLLNTSSNFSLVTFPTE